MQIKKLTLHSNSLDQQYSFFEKILGFNVERNEKLISIAIGASVLEFIDTPVKGKYHYCFLIPCNQIEEAQEWMSKRHNLIPIEPNINIAHFKSWNSHSIYFYDGEGNIAEFIARHDLKNESHEKFGIHSFLSINEIGTPTAHPRSTDFQLQCAMGSQFWKGDLDRFSTHGDENGLFLLPNYKIKTTWYPTDVKVMPVPYSAIIICKMKEYSLAYKDETLTIHIV